MNDNDSGLAIDLEAPIYFLGSLVL
jgi:hypothetical protein